MTDDNHKNSELFYEANFDSLPSQSSTYGVTCVKGADHLSNKLLVALSKGRIFACEYHKHTNSNSNFQGVNREVTFTYIPADCHIISVDNFSCAARGLIIGVTFCKGPGENFFNIYCNYGDDVPHGQEWNLDNVAQNCRSFDLQFTPYQLSHCKVQQPDDDDERTVFILLGSDRYFHVFAQLPGTVEFMEEPVEKYFTELAEVGGQPISLEMKNINVSQRVSVVGYESGEVCVFLVDVDSSSITFSCTIEHDSPIVQCQLYCDLNGEMGEKLPELCDIFSFHLVVVSAREDVMVYRKILVEGFTNPIVLSKSSNYDCVTCCAVADINYNGHVEIMVGTYGQKLLVYSPDMDVEPYHQIESIWTRDFAYPLLKIKLMDLTDDGIEDMAVITTKGVHIMQADINFLLKICKSRLL